MADARLTIDLKAVQANWQALNGMTSRDCEAAAVVKADGYGLKADMVAEALRDVGAETFFVATMSEAVTLRKALGARAKICVFAGLMAGDEEDCAAHGLIPMLNSPEQVQRFQAQMGSHPFGLQLDSGMNRLGIEPEDFAVMHRLATSADLVMSHLACADEPSHPQNAEQLKAFLGMTDGLRCRRSLAATGGTLLGTDFHFDLVRPGVGLYGGEPFADATPVIQIDLPAIQTRIVRKGESVGYAASWVAERDTTVATVSGGYADGILRHLSNTDLPLWADNTPCPILGRVSMDLITVDVSALGDMPDHLTLIGPNQTIDQVADAAGTIGYEILTSLGARYDRRYLGA